MTSRIRRGPAHAFTLLELLVVLGVVSMLSLLLLGSLQLGRGAALGAGQAIVANLIVAARTKAISTNRPVRLLVQFDPTSDSRPSRYLRYLALQVQGPAGWQVVGDAYLPDGVYLVPGNGAVPGGLFGESAALWVRSDGAALRSTALRRHQEVIDAVNRVGVERWLSLPISGVGTTAAAGDLVLATGRPRAPGSWSGGDSPVELTNAEEVCGLAVSQYGVAVLIDRRTGF